MAKEYPVIAVIGTEECKKEMEQIQEKLTKQRHIVVPIGMCGKEDFDMRLDKIDLAEELFVVNPAGKIEMNIWTDICYAYLTGKDISSLESMSYREIQEKANDLIYGSEMLAQRQLEMVQHNSYLDKDVVSFSYKQHTIYDPWIREDMQEEPFAWSMHENIKAAVNPFEHYGKKNASRFVVRIVEKNQ